MKRSLIALVVFAAIPFAAQADDKLSYSYIEGNYVNVDDDADGFGARGSFEFGDSGFYGFGGYTTVEVDGTSIDVDQTQIGLGWAYGVSDNVDLISEASYMNADADGFDADGWRASVGIRGSLSDNFEASAKLNYTDGDQFDGDFGGTIGAQWKWTRTWGLVGEAEFGEDSEIYTVGVRASF